MCFEELYIRTQYDGKDYRSVLSIYYIDSDGVEQELDEVTDSCMDITTCADQGTDTWSWIKTRVADCLKDLDIQYASLSFDEDEPYT